MAPPLYSCSVMLYIQDQDVCAIKLTGVYFPPKAAVLRGPVWKLTLPSAAPRRQGVVVGQLLAGDFNRISWERILSAWASQHGLLLLSDRMQKTYRNGDALDKFLFLPGSAAPEPFLPMGREADEMGQGEGNEAQVFPAITFAGNGWGTTTRRISKYLTPRRSLANQPKRSSSRVCRRSDGRGRIRNFFGPARRSTGGSECCGPAGKCNADTFDAGLRTGETVRGLLYKKPSRRAVSRTSAEDTEIICR